MAERIDGRTRELLEQPNFYYVATLRRDGTPHVVPVWGDVDGDTIRVNSAKGRAWPTHLERDPRVTITVANSENPYEYVTIRGRVTDQTAEGADAHIDALAKKYMGVDVYPGHTPEDTRIILRIEPDEVLHRG